MQIPLKCEPAQWRHRHGEQAYGHGDGGMGGKEEAGEMYGESNMEIYLSYVK